MGDCTDVKIRVITTQGVGQSLTWVLHDEGHAGRDDLTWEFTFQGSEEPEEMDTCIFDNVFTLSRSDDFPGSWQGTVEVVSVVDDNTIYVPPLEKWIIQGKIDPTTALPVTLDARISSGYRNEVSHASIVVRHVRFTGQLATLDKQAPGTDQPVSERQVSSRTVGEEGVSRMGGALYYEGYGYAPGVQTGPVKLIFEHLVFDHGFSTSGGVAFVEGRMSEELGMNQGIELAFKSCFFWKNWATWCGGVIRPNDIWPVHMLFEDCILVDNSAFIGTLTSKSKYGTLTDEQNRAGGLMYDGEETFRNVHQQFTSGGDSFWFLGFPTNHFNLPELLARDGVQEITRFENYSQEGGEAYCCTGPTINDQALLAGPDDTFIVSNTRVQGSHGTSGVNYAGGITHHAGDTLICDHLVASDNVGEPGTGAFPAFATVPYIARADGGSTTLRAVSRGRWHDRAGFRVVCNLIFEVRVQCSIHRRWSRTRRRWFP